MKFLLVESGILGIGIQNPAKEGIQNSFVENPFRIVLTAFTRIHATPVMLKRRPQTVQTIQTTLISLRISTVKIPQDMLAAPTWRRTTRFQLR